MIKIIGIGLSGRESLIRKVQEIIDHADLLMGSNRHLSYFPNCSANKIVLTNFLKDIETIKKTNNQNQSIVILVSGDPLFFGLGRLLLEQFDAKQLEFHPHLSSTQLGFSRLKIPWHDAKLISCHGRNLDELISSLQQGIEKIAVLNRS